MWLVANTNFESELESTQEELFTEALSKRKTTLQLQFLPFLYGNPTDHVLLTEAPPKEFLDRDWPFPLPNYHLLNELPLKNRRT